MAVIAAGELDDHVAAGEAARQADGAHRRLGAGADHAHHFDRTASASMISSASCVSRSVGAPKLAAARHRLVDGLHDARMSMAQDERPPRADVIEVSLPSRSKRYGPSPRAMNSGWPPTAPKARAGLLTPPGMTWQAR